VLAVLVVNTVFPELLFTIPEAVEAPAVQIVQVAILAVMVVLAVAVAVVFT
jgi:hypothetical protein